MMKPKLYQYTVCPFCSKVASLLALKGIEYEAVEVHPLKKKEIEFSKDYQAVPIYIDSKGEQVNDSTPIMRHIDQEFPGRSVFETDPEKIQNENKWLEWSEIYVKCIPTVIYRTFPKALQAFNYITQVGKFSWIESRTVKYTGAFVMSMVAKKIQKRLEIQDPDQFLQTKISEWADGLAGKLFMGGDQPNGADVAVYGISRVIAHLDAGKYFRANVKFLAWFDRMQEQTRLAPVQV